MAGHNHHHQLGQQYDDIKASGSAVGSEDSCYGSHDLSRSSSSTHGVSRPLLTPQDRSSSASSTSVEYAVPMPKQTMSINKDLKEINIINTDETMTSYHLKTFQSSTQYNLKKTVETLTRRPIINLQSTYLTYDSIDTPPSTAKEYSM